MKLNKLILFLLCSIIFFSCKSKTIKKDTIKDITIDSIQKTDSLIFLSIKNISQKIIPHSSTCNERVLVFANLFLQSPYIANTLNVNEKEQVVVNLREFDCATFVENVLAFSLLEDDFSYCNFVSNIEKIRYRNAKLVDYMSRLHYFSDWIYDNQEKKILTNITREIGGVPINKKINFMGNNLKLYAQLKNNVKFQKEILKLEGEINDRKMYFIPEANLAKVESKIQNGDIIAITTLMKGLLVSHTGFAIFVNDRLHLLHASSDNKKVLVSKLPLTSLLDRNKLQTGIIVARLL